MRERTRLLYAALAATALCAPASAIEIIGNMPGNDGTSTFMNAPGGGSNGGGVFDSKAAGFTMPGGLDYTLDFMTLRLEYFTSDSVPMIELYSDAGGPSTLIHTLSAGPVVVGIDNFVFTPTSTVTLSAATTYWMVVWNNASVANSFRWLASTPSQAPTGIATNAGYRFSNGGPPPTGNSTTLNTYSVNATVVPEPATMAALGLGALALVRRRRR
ncbi:MAG: choice-of-anchor R domain-containing protein [Fimbriimonadaceae bacterium]